MNDNKRKLYDALSQDYDLGTFEQFESDIADAGKRRKLYDATIEEYDFGDFSEFENQLGFAPQVETEPQQGFFTGMKAQIADTAKQAMQKPRGGENGYTFTAEELGIEESNGNAPAAPVELQYDGIKPSFAIPGTTGDIPGIDMEAYNANMAKAMAEGKVLSPQETQRRYEEREAEVAERLPQANAAMSQRMQQGQTVQGAFGRAYDNYRDNYPTIEAERLTSGLFDKYAKERENVQGKVKEVAGTYNSATKYVAAPHQYSVADPYTVASVTAKGMGADDLNLIEGFIEDAREEILTNEKLKAEAEENAQALGLELHKYVDEVAVPMLQKRMYKEWIEPQEEEMKEDYMGIMSAFDNSIIGMLANISRTDTERYLSQVGQEEWRKNASQWKKAAADAGSMIFDLPFFGGIGSLASKPAQALGQQVFKGLIKRETAKQVAKGATKEAAQRYANYAVRNGLKNRILLNLSTAPLQSGLTFGMFDAGKTALNMSLGGEWDWSELGKSAAGGTLLGGALGVTSAVGGGLTYGLTGPAKYAGKVAEFGVENAVFTEGGRLIGKLHGQQPENGWLEDYVGSGATLLMIKAPNIVKNVSAIKGDKEASEVFAFNKMEREQLGKYGEDLNAVLESLLPQSAKLYEDGLKISEGTFTEEYRRVMSDPEVSMTTKAKLMGIVEGKVMPAPRVTDAQIEGNRVMTYDPMGQLVEVKEYATKTKAEAEYKKAADKAEIESIAVLEDVYMRIKGYEADELTVKEWLAKNPKVTMERVAEIVAKNSAGEKLTEAEQKILESLRQARREGLNDVRHLNDVLAGLDVDAKDVMSGLDKPIDKRTERENRAVRAYTDVFFREVKDKIQEPYRRGEAQRAADDVWRAANNVKWANEDVKLLADRIYESDRSVDETANDGMVYTTTTPSGEKIIITGGKVVLDNEGYIDVNQSEGLVALMPDGTKKPVRPGDLREKVEVANAEEIKAVKREEIKQEVVAENGWKALVPGAEIEIALDGEVYKLKVEGRDERGDIILSGEGESMAIPESLVQEGMKEAEALQTESGKALGENEVQPVVAPVVEGQKGENGEKVVEPVGETAAPVVEAPKTALEQIPRNEKNVPLYEQVDSELAWDGVVEEAGGNEETAMIAVNSMIADKQDALKKAEKAKAKAGVTITEKIAAENERVANIEKAKADLAKWEEIAGVKAKRALAAEAESKRVADEAAAKQRAEEERLRAEREEAERAEREALNGVPDMVDDKPQDARARGYRRVNGHKVDRQEPVQGLMGKEIAVKFSDSSIPTGRVAVIEAEQLQPSHIQGQRNPLHFIDEAQPKERNDAASVLSARKIAENVRPEEITSSVTAYTGAPTVNTRGEAVQGNNRSAALRLMWENNPEQAAKYKQYLMDHAAEFGLNAEDVAAMKSPVLVNMLDVSDADAITLGQYVAQDTESGGTERIKPKNVMQKMGGDMRSFANKLLASNNEEASFAELVDANGVEVLKWMAQKGYITPTQYKSAFDSKGNLTAEVKNDLRDVMYQSIFKGGSTQLEEMFNALPAKAQKAILATAFRDYDSPNAERMNGEVQNSIRAYYALAREAAFANAKNYKEAKEAAMMWARQYQLDDVSGESFLPSENFSNFAIELAVKFKGETQKTLQNLFNNIYDLIQGTKQASLFEEADNTPRTLKEAIKETFNIDYNGQYDSNSLAGGNKAGQPGRQGTAGSTATGERIEGGERPADSTGGARGNGEVSSPEIPNSSTGEVVSPVEANAEGGNAPGQSGVEKIQKPSFVEEVLENGDKRITNYNSRGEVATVATERDGKVVSVDSYDEGVLFEHTEYDGNGVSTSVTRYDKQGNAIGTQVYVDGKAVPSETTEQPKTGEVANAGPVNRETLQLNMSEEDFNALLNSGDKAAISEYLAEMDGLLRIGVGSPLDGRDTIVKEYRGVVEQYGGEENIPADVVAGFDERIAPYNALQRAVFDRKYALQDKLREIEASEAQAKEQAEKEAKAEHKKTAFGGFLAGKTDLGASAAEKALNKKYNFDGKVMTVAEFVEEAVANGNAKLLTIEEPKYKGASRAAWNRMDARQQEADAKRVKESGTKTVYTVNDHDFGKTAYDYAKFLLDKKAEHEKAAAKQKVKDAIEPFAKEKAAEQAPIKIEDVGEKIGGARKDVIRKYADKIKLDGKTFGTMFPKPEIDQLVEAGLPLDRVAAVKAMFDNAKREYERTKKRLGKDKALSASLFYAMYAKNVLNGETDNFDLKYNGWVFTDWGKEYMKANIALYRAVFEKLGAEYGKMDLAKYAITPLDAQHKKMLNLKALNESNARMQALRAKEKGEEPPVYKDGDLINFVGENHARPSDQFETLEEAVNAMVERIGKEVKPGAEALYKPEVYWKTDERGRADYSKIFVGVKVRGFGTVDLMEFKSSNEARQWLDEHGDDFQQMAAAKEVQVKAENKKPLPKYSIEYTLDRVNSQYAVVANFGKGKVHTLRTFDFPEDDARARMSVFKDEVMPFLNSQEAVQTANEYAEELQQKKSAPKNVVVEKNSRERVGVDWRNGQDATTEMFVDVEGKEPSVFGFRALEFGNYVSQKERQQYLNDIYDALMDMSEVLGVSPRALSLGGKLALAVGARGTSGASGHYEPYKNVINITKTKGAGVLAHEWLHALDRYFSNFDENALYPNGVRYATGKEYAENTRQEIKDAFEKIMSAVRGGEYQKRSARLGDNWASDKELAARALQDYMMRKLDERGQKNDFLSNHLAPEDWAGDMNNYPFPLGAEADRIAEAFDNFFATVEEKTEDGQTVLFQQGMIELDRENPAFERATENVRKKLEATGVKVKVLTKEEAEKALAELEAMNGVEKMSVSEAKKRADAIESLSPINITSNTKTKEELNADYKSLPSVKKGGKMIEFYNSAFKKIYKEGGLFAQIVPQLDKILEQSVMAYYENDNLGGIVRPDGTVHKAHPNISKFYNYIGKVKIGGKEYYVRTTVKEEISGQSGTHSYMVTDVSLYDKTTKSLSLPITTRARGTLSGIVDAKLKDFFDYANGITKNPEFMTVFHGSGAKFDRFDHSFMGSGEGAQVYGWGTYVTEVEGIGRAYANSVTANRGAHIAYNGEPLLDVIDGMGHWWKVNKNRLASAGSASDLRSIIEGLRISENANERTAERFERQRNELLAAIDNGEITVEKPRNLYTVEIPDDNGSNYLHWEERINGEIQERVANGLQNIGFEIEPDMNHLAYSRDGKIAVLNINAKGKDLYAELSEVLGGDKQASLFLSDMGFVGISYPAEAQSGGRADGARNYVIFNEDDAVIESRIEFLRTSDGTTYGWAVNGEIYLTPEGLNPNTPIHEYTHLWAAALQKSNPKLWGEVVEAMKLSPAWNEVMADDNYTDIHGDENRVASEVLSRLSGNEGYRRYMEQAEAEIAAERDIVGKVQKKGILNRIKNAVSRFWNWLKGKFGSKAKAGDGTEAKAEPWDVFVNKSLKDFDEGVNPDAKDSPLDRMFIGKKVDREGNVIGDGSSHVEYKVDEVALSYPNISYKVDKSATTPEMEYNVAKENEERYNSPEQDIPVESVQTQPMTFAEKITNSVLEASAKNKENLALRSDALRMFGRDVANILKLMGKQREYDKSTVDQLVKLAKMYFKDAQLLGGLTPHQVGRVMTRLNNAVGKRDITDDANELVNILVDAHNKELEKMLEKQAKTKAKKVNASGVEVIGKLDKEGQLLLEEYNAGKELDLESIDDKIIDLQNEAAEGKAEEAAARIRGLELARQYREEILKKLDEIKGLEQELKSAEQDAKDGAMDRAAYKEFRRATERAILESKLEMVDAYHGLIHGLGGDISSSAKRAKLFQQQQIDHVKEIQHNANSDLLGHPAEAQGETPDKWNNSVPRLFMSAMPTFQTMLKFFGEKAADGRGYLYERFIPQHTQASHNEYVGKTEAREKMRDKLTEIFGKKTSIEDFLDMSRKDGVVLEYQEGGQKKTIDLTRGQVLYLYMINKMADGQMKLSRMGITDADVLKMAKELPEEMVRFADWVQEDFLTELREKYNKVNERMFGAPMAAIESYFPIKINKRSRGEKIEPGMNAEDKPSTVTGALIKRTKNAIAVDLSTDAMQTLLEHIDEMEGWAAWAEFRRDVKSLLNYRHFQNQVKGMESLRHGSGEKLWDNFVDVANIAMGSFKPSSTAADRAVRNIAKGVVSSKIAFRYFTAVKQFLSTPAFWSEVDFGKMMNAYLHQKEAWDWAMKNLPGFSKRWEGRAAGNEILLESDKDWKVWKNRMVQWLSKEGMRANAFIDALTVATGAKAVFETKYEMFKKAGYSEERAREKALNRAAEAYNESQQSSESAYLSPLQAEATFVSSVLTAYRNSPFGYNRKMATAIANLKKKMKKGFKQESIEYMIKQLMRDGLNEEQAKKFAKSTYRRSVARDAADVALYGFFLNYVWVLGPSLIYIFGGDDDEKKKDLNVEALIDGAMGGVGNLPAGETLTGAIKAIAEGDVSNFKLPQAVAMQDMETIADLMQTDPVRAAGEVLNILVAMGVGVNPQTFTDMFVALADTEDWSDPREIAMLVLRLINAPNSKLELLEADEAMENYGANIEEITREYAEYQKSKRAPLTGWLYSDESEQKAIERYEKRFKKILDERFEVVVENTDEYDMWYENSDPQMKAKLAKLRQKFLEGDKETTMEKLDSIDVTKKVLFGSGYDEVNTVYYELSTAEDEDMAMMIDQKLKELKPMMDEYKKLKGDERKAYREENLEQIQFYNKLNAHKNNVNNLKGAMKKKPEEAQEKMEKIRKIRTKAIDLINDYNE